MCTPESASHRITDMRCTRGGLHVPTLLVCSGEHACTFSLPSELSLHLTITPQAPFEPKYFFEKASHTKYMFRLGMPRLLFLGQKKAALTHQFDVSKLFIWSDSPMRTLYPSSVYTKNLCSNSSGAVLGARADAVRHSGGNRLVPCHQGSHPVHLL